MDDIAVFFFDMGSTVLDFHTASKTDEEMEQNGLNHVFAHLEMEYGFKDKAKLNKELFLPWFEYINKNRKECLQEIRIDELIFNYFSNNGIYLNYEEIVKILKLHYSEYTNTVIINDGFIETAKYLKSKSKKLGIISNIPYPDIIFLDIFKKLNLLELFDHYMFSYSNVYLKPHKSMYIRSLMNFGINPAQSIMIGDNYKADIIGAKEVGMKTCLYDNKFKNKRNESDYYINNFKEIINFFRENKLTTAST